MIKVLFAAAEAVPFAKTGGLADIVGTLPRALKKLKVDAQEQVIGRTKLESIELDEDVQPENSHVSRTVVEDDAGDEMEILRHSLPYGDGKGDQGLFFIAYTKDLSIIDAMLERMFGTSGDGIHDRLLHFVTALDGAYYFAPSEELLEEVLED